MEVRKSNLMTAHRKEQVYWKAFVGFLGPLSRDDLSKNERKRSFEYMELSDPHRRQTPQPTHRQLRPVASHVVCDSNIRWICQTPEVFELDATSGYLSSPSRCVAQTPEYRAANNGDDLNRVAAAVRNNHRQSNLEENSCKFPQAEVECEESSTDVNANCWKTQRKERLLSATSIDEEQPSFPLNTDLANKELCTQDDRLSLQDQTSQDNFTHDKQSESSSLTDADIGLLDEGLEFHPFIPTLCAIAEEDEEERSFQLTKEGKSEHHSSTCKLDDPSSTIDSECVGRIQDDALSSQSFGGSLRKSSTIENLSLDECDDAWKQMPDGATSNEQTATDNPECSKPFTENVTNEVEETALSNHSSQADSAYSSHEKLNYFHRSTPDLLSADSLEDLEYCPVSYADSSLKRKRKKWPTFGLGDSKESLTKISGSSRFGSFRKKLSRKLSRRDKKHKTKSTEHINTKTNTYQTRPTSFRKTIMRVFRNTRNSEQDADVAPEPRPRSWSLPARNLHTTTVGLATDDSDVIVSELAII